LSLKTSRYLCNEFKNNLKMKEKIVSFDYEIEQENGDILSLKVTATYSPPSRGCRDSFGAPLEPDEPENLCLEFFDLVGLSIPESILKSEYPDDFDRIVERAWEQLESEAELIY
jgi:hypothetical protein